MCPVCKQPVSGQAVKALEKTFHVDCFKCRQCMKAITGSFHAGPDGLPYCRSCHEDAFADKCAACGKALTGSYLVAEDKMYHSACFVCSVCGQPFDGSYLIKDGKPVCNKCA